MVHKKIQKRGRRERMWPSAIACVASILACAASARAETRDTWTDPFPGVRHLHRVTTDPNQNINVLEIGLCEPGVCFRATRYEERGQTTSAFGTSVGAQAAINGDFFVSGFGLDRGFAVGNGSVWPAGANPDDASTGQL